MDTAEKSCTTCKKKKSADLFDSSKTCKACSARPRGHWKPPPEEPGKRLCSSRKLCPKEDFREGKRTCDYHLNRARQNALNSGSQNSSMSVSVGYGGVRNSEFNRILATNTSSSAPADQELQSIVQPNGTPDILIHDSSPHDQNVCVLDETPCGSGTREDDDTSTSPQRDSSPSPPSYDSPSPPSPFYQIGFDTITSNPVKLATLNHEQQLEMSPEALQLLRNAKPPLHVLSMSGVAREGKSTWLTMLLRYMDKPGSDLLFDVSQGTRSCTGGCWMWVAQLTHGHGSIVLMDTQGLACGDDDGTSRLFVMSALASSVMVLNVMRQINDTTLDKLGALATLAKIVEFSSRTPFPKLWFLIRDFDLAPEGGLESYLEEVLTDDGHPRDATRQAIKQVFSHRQIVTMEAPTKHDKRFLNSWCSDGLRDSGLMESGDFVESFQDAAAKVLDSLMQSPKRLGQLLIGGQELADFLEHIVKAINAEQVEYQLAVDSIVEKRLNRELHAAKREAEIQLDGLNSRIPEQSEVLQKHYESIQFNAVYLLQQSLAAVGISSESLHSAQCASQLKQHLAPLYSQIMLKNEQTCESMLATEVSHIKSQIDTATRKVEHEEQCSAILRKLQSAISEQLKQQRCFSKERANQTNSELLMHLDEKMQAVRDRLEQRAQVARLEASNSELAAQMAGLQLTNASLHTEVRDMMNKQVFGFGGEECKTCRQKAAQSCVNNMCRSCCPGGCRRHWEN